MFACFQDRTSETIEIVLRVRTTVITAIMIAGHGVRLASFPGKSAVWADGYAVRALIAMTAFLVLAFISPAFT
jgi:ABC-type thiamin/hydroxymethylpyrimidine transport system permease subunit